MNVLQLTEQARGLRRALGPTGWVVLEDLAVDALVDTGGVVVVTTSVRVLAEHLDLNKDTTARAMGRLIAAGILVRRPQQLDAVGRFGAAVYELHLPAGLTVKARPTSVDAARRVDRPRRQLCDGRSDGQLSLLDNDDDQDNGSGR